MAMTDPGATPTAARDETRQLVAVYETHDEARRARDALTSAGIPGGDVEILNVDETGSTRTEARADDGLQDEGFWGAIKRLFVPEDETHHYAEGLRRGHAVLVVRPRSDMYQRAVDILEETDPIDFDTRVADWRNAGWAGRYNDATAGTEGSERSAATGVITPGTSGTLGTAAALGATAASGTATRPAGTNAVAGEAATARVGTAARASTEGEQRIPIVEERLRVGKREVLGGAVRVRSYVVERPVEEQVRLREEQVHVDRRAVDQPLRAGEDPFRERTIEVTARSEEAVVSKEARVREEVVINKEASERTEVVRDTVRRTEVEVDDQSTTEGKAPATPGTSRPANPTTDPAKR